MFNLEDIKLTPSLLEFIGRVATPTIVATVVTSSSSSDSEEESGGEEGETMPLNSRRQSLGQSHFPFM